MVTPTSSKKQPSRTLAQQFYNPLGFRKAYNFALWIIFAGAMLGFCLARLMYLDFSKNFCPASGPSPSGNSAAPGECYYYLNFDRYKVGILLHLGGVLPAGILAVLQFTPFIRYRWIIVHRITGYFSLTLYIISLVGALMIARHAFGGGLEVQAWVGFVGIGVLICFIISYINIKRLQIEQHRAWMLRGWFYAGSIITARIIMIIATTIISKTGAYNALWPCAKIAATLPNVHMLLTLYPSCAAFADGSDLNAIAPVLANLSGRTAANSGAALNLTFGMALWLATAIHAVGVEAYLQLTPKEANRLRQVSYQRQLEAGMRNPGSAGLVVQKLGDADAWVPELKV